MDEQTPLDAATKERIRTALEARATAQLAGADGVESEERSAAELDQDASYSVDDLSQSDEEGELSGLIGAAAERRRDELERIRALDLGPKDTVQPGAVVAFGGDHYVVGVVADSFESDGVSYEGISADSPVYAAIAGLRAGDTFTFNGAEHRIDVVG